MPFNAASSASKLTKYINRELTPLLKLVLLRRPFENGAYTKIQAWRSVLTIATGACARFGMSNDDIRKAVDSSLDGYAVTDNMKEVN